MAPHSPRKGEYLRAEEEPSGSKQRQKASVKIVQEGGGAEAACSFCLPAKAPFIRLLAGLLTLASSS